MTRAMRDVFVIALNSYRESIRTKILWGFFVLTAAVIAFSTVLSATAIGERVKLIKDFSLAAISIASVAYVVVAGSSLLAKELNRRTVFNILAKPVARTEFLLGKFFGLYVTALVLVTLMGGGLSAFLFFVEGSLDLSLFQVYGALGLELAVVCALTIFFSTVVVTPILNGLFCFGAFLAGRSVEYLLELSQDTDMPDTVRTGAKGLYFLLPHLDRLYIANDIVYNVPLPHFYLCWSAVNAFGYSAILLLIASLLFERRQFL